ncbi:VOC family protein [Nocardioides sp. SYSU D00038]|uniref:VOC family protein n=1 Tax=Nocardioides sp. SYSU D00038 TaxID=2812554 RepID=UPI0019674B61|nr:VOC family protein [Nocardioides sp. SYSU D00038]
MTPSWVTAFLDLPAAGHEASVGFWQRVTGHALSAPRGDHDEFATLVPSAGDDHLRVQRVGDGPPRVHLDLHVPEVAAAAEELVALGAAVTDDAGDHLVLRSPGGLPFCLVDRPAATRSAPRTWPDGRVSEVDQVCLDVPPGRYDAELDFWSAATGWHRRDPAPGSEFGRLTPDDRQPVQLLLQRLDDEEPAVRAHLDWATTDRPAEVAAHVAAGAEVVATHDDWTVLRDPGGLVYCVTRRSPRVTARTPAGAPRGWRGTAPPPRAG